MNRENMEGTVVVVTGASSGFGRGIATRFAQAGASVVAAARREDILEQWADEVDALGGTALGVKTDVSKPKDMEALAERTLQRFGRIDVWVNNAGVGAVGRFTDIPLEDHIQLIETNFLGVVHGSYFAWQQFLKQRYGTLINIASELGKMPAPYYASYAASKHAVVALSQALRQELGEDESLDIHVCTIMPSATDTFFFDHSANYTGHENVPISPLYDPDDVIDKVFEMASAPQDEVIMTGKTKVMNMLHNMAPNLVDKMTEKQVRAELLEKAPPAKNTPGAIREPVPYGTDVSPRRRHR